MNDLNHAHLNSATATMLVRRPRSVALKPALLLIAASLLTAAGVRTFFNWQSGHKLAEYTQTLLQRSVLVTRAKPGNLVQHVRLPTSLRGATETVVYARTTGYLSLWKKDIGDPVVQGEILAVIDAPEQEQELAQARAQRQQIAARLGLARQTLARWEQLGARNGAATEQDLAEKRSLQQQADAELAAADANVRRLEQQREFRHITAPFAGVIPRRNVEVGDLIRSAGQELFAIAATDPLRLTVWIPQAYSHQVKVGQHVQVQVQLKELPGADIKATLERLAGGLDPETRARQADLALPNPDGRLLPGAYAEVSLEIAGTAPALVVPPSVLLVNANGPQVVVVDKENRVVFRPVKLGRDLGREVEILAGISTEDNLVVSPSDQLQAGEQVKSLPWSEQKR